MHLGHSRETIRARAVVLSASESKWIKVNTGMYGSAGSHSRHTDYQVQVVPEDGQRPFEATMSTWGKFADWGNMIAGYSVYVLYDPHEPDTCELDRGWFDEVQANWPENATRDADWLRQRREQKLGHLQARIQAAGGHPDPATDPAAYWFQRSQQALAASHATHPADRLGVVEKLHESGALSDDEYDAKRQQIIDSI